MYTDTFPPIDPTPSPPGIDGTATLSPIPGLLLITYITYSFIDCIHSNYWSYCWYCWYCCTNNTDDNNSDSDSSYVL